MPRPVALMTQPSKVALAPRASVAVVVGVNATGHTATVTTVGALDLAGLDQAQRDASHELLPLLIRKITSESIALSGALQPLLLHVQGAEESSRAQVYFFLHVGLLLSIPHNVRVHWTPQPRMNSSVIIPRF